MNTEEPAPGWDMEDIAKRIAEANSARQQRIAQERRERMARCTCCPVHPRHDIPFGGSI